MKKNLKRLFILITFLVGFTGFSVKADGFKVGDSISISEAGTLTVADVTGFGDASEYSDHIYSASGSGKNYVTYCLDPGWPQPHSYEIEKIFGEETDDKAYWLGLQEIIINGRNQDNDSFKGLSGDNLYAATSIASRAYIMGVYGRDKGVQTKEDLRETMIVKSSSYISLGIEWAATIDNKVIQALTSSSCTGSGETFIKCYSNEFIKKTGHDWYDSQYILKPESSTVLSVAYELFSLGINKAYSVLNGEESSASITGTANKGSSDKTTSGNTITEYYNQTLEFKNFDKEKGKIENLTLTCDKCSANGITIGDLEVLNPQTGSYQSAAGVEVLSLFTATGNTKSGKIQLRFKVTRASDDEKCQSSDYKISYSYDDPSVEYVGALVSSKSNTEAQTFAIVQKKEGELKDELKGSISCAMSCETEIEVPVCSTNENDAIAKITGPLKIKTCIINNSDDAGNSYQFTADAGGVDNSYCKVYCKEDYAQIKLNPIVQDVKCGGYFKLKSFISGTKSCYTGGDTEDSATNGAKSIDKDKYIKDIIAVQENLVDAMNRYYEFKAKSEHKKDESTSDYSCGESCGTKTTITASWTSYQKVDFTWFEKTESGAYTYYSAPADSTSWSDSCSCDTCGSGDDTYSCCGGCDNSASSSYSSWVSMVKSELARAESDLKKYMEDYKRYIQDYNACTTGWANEFAFAQKVKYYYDENHGESGKNYTPYYDLLKNNEELTYLAKEGEEKVTYSLKINKGKTDDLYESGDWITVNNSNGTIDSGNTDEYNYNSQYGSSIFDTRNYVICSVAKGCVTDTRQISGAAFIKKEVSKEQEYITPTAFYQIAANGKVVVYGDYAVDKVQLEELTNMLPVSTSSVGGGNFKLMIEGLGEFYSEKSQYGRLIDFKQSNESRSVAKAIGVDTFNGEYICQYENNCRPKDCPTCEFVCEGDNCEWRECPSCNISCVNCIFDLGSLNILAKTITTTDVNAANRSQGYNWITTSSLEALSLLNKKATTTIAEIEEINEMVYDDKTTDGSTLGFSIKLTPAIIKTITNYNKENEDKGGYINNSLQCYDATIDGEVYKNIYCYSELIDELLDEYEDNITVLPDRINDEGRRESETQGSGYWQLWSSFSVDKTSESVIGGPAWK